MGQSVHVARRRGKIAGLCIALSLMVGIIAERAAATATGGAGQRAQLLCHLADDDEGRRDARAERPVCAARPDGGSSL